MTSRSWMSYCSVTPGLGLALWIALCTLQPTCATAQQQSPPAATTPTPAPLPAGQVPLPAQTAPPAAQAATLPMVEPSAAEQITRLEKSIQTDMQRLAKLRDEVADPKSEYALAETAFRMLDDQLVAANRDLAVQQKLEPAGVEPLERQLEDLTKKHKLARERFDLAIQTKKTLQEQIAALESKQKQDQQALAKLTGNVPVPAPVVAAIPVEGATAPVVAMPTATPAAVAAAPVVEPVAAPAPVAAAPAPAVAVAPEAAKPAEPAAPAAVKPPSKELVAAETEAQIKKEIALAAEQDARSVTERMQALDKDIELEGKLLVATRKKADIAYQTAQALEEEKEKRLQEGISAEDLRALRKSRREAEATFQSARTEVAERVDRLNQLQSQRAELQREELAALHQADKMHEDAKTAEEKVTQLKNPLSVHNLLQWLLDHGLKVALILIAMLAVRWILTIANKRIVQLMVMRGARGSLQEREDRAKTLVGVFHNAVTVTVMISGVLMIFEEVGIAVAPLMGGAAVLGLAVAFGAQNLIRDYFYGFVILLENQYKLNDVLKIGELAGQVEQITLRMTVLRDLEGNVHFIPNGKIDSVTNMTHGWSRAVIDVGVAYGENAENVMSVLMDVAREVRLDPEFRSHIIAEPEMLGVNVLGDSSVTVRFLVKTRPLSRWTVKRELLRRIKQRFDELGIEIPFPQRVVHHRYDQAEADIDAEDLPETRTLGLPRKSA